MEDSRGFTPPVDAQPRRSRLFEIISTIESVHGQIEETNHLQVVDENEVIQAKPHEHMSNANFPMANGRTMHLNVKMGDVANRVVSVGSHTRAKMISELLEKNSVMEVASVRGFHTYTGMFNGVRVSIVATGMGIPMADFVAREVRAVVDCSPENPLYLIRLGTCGTVSPDISVGSVAVAESSISVIRNPDAFGENSESTDYFRMSKPIKADPALFQSILSSYSKYPELKERVFPCLNCTADSFYSSQGRQDANFLDHNETLIDSIALKYPEAGTLEMESFQFFDLARSCLPAGCFRAAATTIVLAQRKKNTFIEPEVAEMLERVCGKAVLEAITAV